MHSGIALGFRGLSPIPVLLLILSGAREGPRNYIFIPKEDGTVSVTPEGCLDYNDLEGATGGGASVLFPLTSSQDLI